MPKKLFRLHWQPARRDVAKESAAAGSPQRPYVPRNELVSSGTWQPARLPVQTKRTLSAAGWQPADGLMPFRLRAGRKDLFRLRAGSPQRRDVPRKTSFVSSAGWQPAEALCAGKALFVCGLAARTA